MIEFRCRQCGKSFAVPGQYAGRRAKCKACGGDVQVPALTTPAASQPPTGAKPPLRTRRLIAEAQQMRQAFSGDGPIRIESTVGDPPERYRMAYAIRGLERSGDAEPLTRGQHVIEIECTAEYPRVSPRCRILTPIFHPNFDQTTICVGDHWTAGERLVDLVVRIGQMIAYQAYNIKSPLNGEAAMWADLNRDRFPIDKIDLHTQVDKLTA